MENIDLYCVEKNSPRVQPSGMASAIWFVGSAWPIPTNRDINEPHLFVRVQIGAPCYNRALRLCQPIYWRYHAVRSVNEKRHTIPQLEGFPPEEPPFLANFPERCSNLLYKRGPCTTLFFPSSVSFSRFFFGPPTADAKFLAILP